LYFLRFEAHPKPSHPDYGRVDGAEVAVFVDEEIQAAAEAAARDFIDGQLWDIEKLEDAYSVQFDAFDADDPGRARFEQALADGLVATFHEWPVGAPDDHESGSSSGAV
jgi:hypothetical protein